MHLNVKGVPKDIVQADMWLSLAAASGDTMAAAFLNGFENKMTPQQ
jgi:TPR repeat protein